ncbi:MAG: nucleotide exchange factor GrpE [Planctomycetota bacterium]|jgi:molecular chaperone GrpE
MRKGKHKIEIATPAEVEQYAEGKLQGASEAVTEATEAPPDASAAEQEARPAEAEKPEDRLAALARQVEELTDKHLRAVAEHQNYVRRAGAERAEASRYAAAELVKALLPVVDDFERTLAAIPEDDASSVVQGVRLIYDNLVKTLSAHHVERIAAVGVPFDPACHQAMTQQPSADHPPGTVLQEYQAGYKLWDRVLRPAKVIVSNASAEDAEQGPDQPQERAASEADSADRSATDDGREQPNETESD